MQEDRLTSGHHALTMDDCRRLSLTGVEEVLSFDEMTVVVVTSCGNLTVEGDGLHVSRLDLEKGECDVEGSISGFFYSKLKEKSGGLFKRAKDR
jgi:sporulation protein YabP